ncbi:MAG: hypothetical protein R3F59_24765 [Myxococcota bacterium]
MRWFGFGLVAGLVGCAGEEAADSCDVFEIVVNVTDVNGESVSDATVELNNGECANNGDGSYTCQAAYSSGDETDVRAFHLIALHPSFSSASTFVALPEGFCDGVSTDLQLGVMMGA